jgi:Ribonuclease G/E
VIGKGGVVIRALMEETGATIDIADDGTVTIASTDQGQAEEAKRRIELLTAEVEVGRVYEGVVQKIMDFGAFITILPGRDGLLHISQISEARVEVVADHLAEGQVVRVNKWWSPGNGADISKQEKLIGNDGVHPVSNPLRHRAAPRDERPISLATVLTLALLFIYAATLLGLAPRLSSYTFDTVFAEGGIVETWTIWLWLGLAIVLLTRCHGKNRVRPALLSALCIAAAAREADWHRQFTGKSMLKISYYLTPGPLLEKAVAAILFLCLLSLCAYALTRAVGFLRAGGFRLPAGQLLLVGMMLLIATKLMDRGPELIAWALVIDVPIAARRMAEVLEEGLEFAMAAIFLAAALCSTRDTSMRGNLRQSA